MIYLLSGSISIRFLSLGYITHVLHSVSAADVQLYFSIAIYTLNTGHGLYTLNLSG